jgi:hypothetical protein
MADLTLTLPLVASLALTPVVMALWQRAAPPTDSSEFDALGVAALTERNGRLNSLFTLLMFVGLLVPLPILLSLTVSSGLRAFGFMALTFGLMVDLPVVVIGAITMREGVKRFQEFWRFYEIKYGIGLRGIAWVYIPIGLLAPIGLLMVLLGT